MIVVIEVVMNFKPEDVPDEGEIRRALEDLGSLYTSVRYSEDEENSA